MKLILSAEAERNFANTKAYIKSEWSEKSAQKFSGQVFKCLLKISQYPEMYPYFSKPRLIRKSKASRHTIIYYRVNKDVIEVLALKDERQDARKFKF